jgi:uncharacterized membrane protein YgaE (UPF0421/DUF939 family)
VLAGRDLVSETQLALKMSLAAGLSWWLATLAGEPRPIFAALVGLVALSGDPFQALNVSVARVVGVFAGVGIGIGLLEIDLRLLWLVVLGLVLGALAGIPLRVGDRPNIQPAVSVLFLVGLSSTGAVQVGVARLWETALGAGVTLLVAVLVWPPDPVHELRHKLERLRQELAIDLAAVADGLASGSSAVSTRMDDIRSHSVDAVRTVLQLEQARRALRLNPRRRHDAAEFEAVEQRIRLAARAYRHTRAIARDVIDTKLESRELAAAARTIAGAIDLALHGDDAHAEIAAASGLLAHVEASEPDALVVGMQLRQLLADLEGRLGD